VREATAEDVPEMIHLERQSPGAAHWSEQQYAAVFDDAKSSRRLALVVERAGYVSAERLSVTGFLVAHHLAPEWELENIVVAPEARGKGIGTRLVRELFARAARSESDSVLLEVRESNQAARALYENLGFRESGRRKSYYSNPLEDAVLYVRMLR